MEWPDLSRPTLEQAFLPLQQELDAWRGERVDRAPTNAYSQVFGSLCVLCVLCGQNACA